MANRVQVHLTINSRSITLTLDGPLTADEIGSLVAANAALLMDSPRAKMKPTGTLSARATSTDADAKEGAVLRALQQSGGSVAAAKHLRPLLDNDPDYATSAKDPDGIIRYHLRELTKKGKVDRTRSGEWVLIDREEGPL